MHSNLETLPDLVRFAKTMDVDNVKLLRLNGEMAPDEILKPEDEARLVKMMSDPCLQDPIVDCWGMLPYLKAARELTGS